MEERNARFTLLIDADQKRAFERLCEAEEVTASHMVRELIAQYLQAHGVQDAPAPSANGEAE